MELYTLNSALKRESVIDVFESLIWTERFSSWGDFELHLISTSEMRRLLPAGTLLAMNLSYRVMKVETVEDSIDSEGRELLKITGRSIESILDDRVARNTFSNLTEVPKWVLTGTPGQIARKIFNDICRTNGNFPDDEIPYLVDGTLIPRGGIPESSEVITVELDIKSVYDAVQEICDTYDLGFRLVRNFDNSELYFDIYSGDNRTTFQSGLAPVVFAPNLDNLTDINSITSIASHKNVAYVFHPVGTQIVTADGIPVEVEGFERRIMTVDASDIKIPERTYTVTENQQRAINVALKLETILEEQKTALDKLLKKQRLFTVDRDALDVVMTSTKLTESQKTYINNARSTSTNYDTTETNWLNKQLQLRGRDELSKYRQFSALEGKLPADSPYPYDISYRMGDLVEMRNSDGVANIMRVSEQIFVEDGQGERSYPTLLATYLIQPNTWQGWDRNMVWETAPGEWGDLGDPSDVVNPGAPTAPAAMSTPSTTPYTTSTKLTYVAPANNGAPITKYEIQYSEDPTMATGATLTSRTTLTATISGLKPDTEYSYRIRAVNSAGSGRYSPIKTTRTLTGIPLSVSGLAGTKMTVPTHLSPPGGQTTHPSVVDFGSAWNGYRYWMAHTPYPAGNDDHEDPNIVASVDGDTWVTPSGLTNPIDNQPGSPGPYNSDVDLVAGPDGYLWLFWRTYTASATGKEEQIFLSRSNDGKTWTNKVLIWQTSASSMRLLSPTFVYEDGAWTMWAVDIVGTFTLRRVRSTGSTLTGPSSWGSPTACSLPSTGSGRQPWHIEIRKIDDLYIGMLNDRPTGVAPGGNLHIIRSLDGVTWNLNSTVAIPRVGGGSPGHQNLYRATFVRKSSTTLDCWYSGWNDTPAPSVWNIFRTTLA